MINRTPVRDRPGNAAGPLRQTVKDALLAVARASVYAVSDLYGGTVGRLLAARSQDYLKDAEEPKLHLGCADMILPGWLNTDVYPCRLDVAYCNATKRFLFPDNSFAYVFTEHMIGHVLPRGGENLIRESFRILRPVGRIRIATPDLNKIIALKEPNLTDTENCELRSLVFPEPHDRVFKIAMTQANSVSRRDVRGHGRLGSASHIY